MNKVKIFTIILFFLMTSLNVVNAASVKGPADIYKILMKKIELCTGHTTGNFDNVATSTTQCQNAVTIGESTAGVEMDIASVDAGQVAASFGDTMVLPLGETYTHARITVDRKFKLRTASTIDTTATEGGQAIDDCKTIATTDAMYVNSEAQDKYTHLPAIPEGGNSGVSEEMTMYLIDGTQVGDRVATYHQCASADCSAVRDFNNTWNWQYAAQASDLSSAVAMQTMRSSLVTDNVSLIYPLAAPFTVSLISPKIDMSFSTTAAVKAQEITNRTFCMFSVSEPKVTITIQ